MEMEYERSDKKNLTQKLSLYMRYFMCFAVCCSVSMSVTLVGSGIYIVIEYTSERTETYIYSSKWMDDHGIEQFNGTMMMMMMMGSSNGGVCERRRE